MKEVKFTSITDALCYAISRHFDTISYSFEEGKLSVRKDEVVEYCPWKCNPHVAFNGFGHLFPNTGLPVNKQPELYFDVNGLREHYIKFRLSFSSAKFVEVPKSLARYLLITKMPAFFNEQLNCFLLTQEDLRDIILGKVIYGQCLQCNETGRENWNEDGEDVRPGHSDDPARETGKCENCEGVGYIIKQDNR